MQCYAQPKTVAQLIAEGDHNSNDWTEAARLLNKNEQPTAEQLSAVRAVGAELKQKLHSLMNAEEKLEGLKERQAVLSKNDLPKCPPGMKPHKAPKDFPSLDFESKFASTPLVINIPAGDVREILSGSIIPCLLRSTLMCGRTGKILLSRTPRWSSSFTKSE
jgi:hypothetical protein